MEGKAGRDMVGASGSGNGKTRVCGSAADNGNEPDRSRGGRDSGRWMWSGIVAAIPLVLVFFINPIGASEVDPGCIEFKPGDQPIH